VTLLLRPKDCPKRLDPKSLEPEHLDREPPRRHAWVLLPLLALIWLPSALAAQQVIVNPEVDVSALDRNRARLIFTMRINQWRDQQPVTVFVLPDDASLHQRFAKSALQVYPYQLRRTWDRQVFSGTGQAPLQVADEEEMIERVRQTAGAIGYISDQRAAAGVKVIEVR